MLIIFVSLLAALGAAFAFRGREHRGLTVLLVANATDAAGAGLTARWPWLAFSLGMCALCALGIAMARSAPEPAPEEPERDPDWCWTHGKLEPKEER